MVRPEYRGSLHLRPAVIPAVIRSIIPRPFFCGLPCANNPKHAPEGENAPASAAWCLDEVWWRSRMMNLRTNASKAISTTDRTDDGTAMMLDDQQCVLEFKCNEHVSTIPKSRKSWGSPPSARSINAPGC